MYGYVFRINYKKNIIIVVVVVIIIIILSVVNDKYKLSKNMVYAQHTINVEAEFAKEWSWDMQILAESAKFYIAKAKFGGLNEISSR